MVILLDNDYTQPKWRNLILSPWREADCFVVVQVPPRRAEMQPSPPHGACRTALFRVHALGKGAPRHCWAEVGLSLTSLRS